MSLSSWLKDYLYISLGGNRKGKLRTYLNLFLTMLLGGLWHGASFRFILWGAMHGAALMVHKFFLSLFPITSTKKFLPEKLSNLIGVILTFHFVCFCWIFFRAGNMEIAGQMISQITTHFTPQIFLEFVSGYKIVLSLMIVGYLLHFIPKEIESKAEQWFTEISLTAKAAIMIAIVLLVIQTKSAGIQPFIYFQF